MEPAKISLNARRGESLMQAVEFRFDLVTVICFIITAVVLSLIVWSTVRAPKFQHFRRDYFFRGVPPEKVYECTIVSSHAENPFPCRIGADGNALYILAQAAAVGRAPWRTRLRVLSFRLTYAHDLRLPWTDLQCRFASSFGREVVGFEIPSRRVLPKIG